MLRAVGSLYDFEYRVRWGQDRTGTVFVLGNLFLVDDDTLVSHDRLVELYRSNQVRGKPPTEDSKETKGQQKRKTVGVELIE